ncbi:MAG: hypothetical protein D6732_17280 [Methanobacteriota archaeon]|nr:MAG: hypothetical protein D6732_17280 [Euryarchaeota archaeon]
MADILFAARIPFRRIKDFSYAVQALAVDEFSKDENSQNLINEIAEGIVSKIISAEFDEARMIEISYRFNRSVDTNESREVTRFFMDVLDITDKMSINAFVRTITNGYTDPYTKRILIEEIPSDSLEAEVKEYKQEFIGRHDAIVIAENNEPGHDTVDTLCHLTASHYFLQQGVNDDVVIDETEKKIRFLIEEAARRVNLEVSPT